MALLAQTTAPERPPLAVRHESWRRGWYRFSRNPTAVAGPAITILVILIALLAPVIAPFPASAGNYVNFAAMLQPPSWPHILGTDNAGRDLLTRIMFGYRISLALVVVVLAIGVPLGVVIGLAAGFVILIGAGLSFLGLGVQPPQADLGTMVAAGVNDLPKAWWETVFPGLAIVVAVLGFNLLGDGLRDLFDVE